MIDIIKNACILAFALFFTFAWVEDVIKSGKDIVLKVICAICWACFYIAINYK